MFENLFAKLIKFSRIFDGFLERLTIEPFWASCWNRQKCIEINLISNSHILSTHMHSTCTLYMMKRLNLVCRWKFVGHVVLPCLSQKNSYPLYRGMMMIIKRMGFLGIFFKMSV